MVKDLVVLVADKDTQFTLQGLFSRNRSLNIQDISKNYDIFVHIQRDPGCYNQCVDFLRPFTKEYKFALVIFDHEGSGQEKKSREDIETELEQKLMNSGWGERASVIILEPELEVWVWNDSPQVEKILGWEGCKPNLQSWLIQNNLFKKSEMKPAHPKEAMEESLRQVRKPRSSAIYQELAERVSFRNCKDSSFIKFKKTLQNWFPEL
jgi:hypothetical protein